MRCEKCKKEESTLTFSREPHSALIRRYGSIRICRGCYIKMIKRELIDINANLREQEKLFAKEKRAVNTARDGK